MCGMGSHTTVAVGCIVYVELLGSLVMFKEVAAATLQNITSLCCDDVCGISRHGKAVARWGNPTLSSKRRRRCPQGSDGGAG